MPSSQARCSAPWSRAAWARAARPTARAPTPRWSGPTASSATRCGPTPTAATWQQGRLGHCQGQSSHASRIRHQQYRLDARRQLDAFLHRPRSTSPSPTHAASPRPRRRRVSGGLRAAAARDGGDSAELLAAAQADRKAKLDAGRVDTVSQVGDRVLPWTKELLDAADIGRLRPRWDGPFTVLACPSRNAYTLALPREMRCSPTIIVDHLKRPSLSVSGPRRPRGPSLTRDRRASTKLLLNRRRVRGITRYLVRWRGRTSVRWSRCSLRPASGMATGGPGPALMGRTVLYYWPGYGWVRGTVVRRSRTQGFSHVVRYGPRSRSALPVGRPLDGPIAARRRARRRRLAQAGWPSLAAGSFFARRASRPVQVALAFQVA